MPLHTVYQFGTLTPENLVVLIRRPDVALVQIPNSTTVHVVMAEGHTDPPPGLDMPTARFYAFIVDPPDNQSHNRAITFMDSHEAPNLQAEESYSLDPPLQGQVARNPNGTDVPVWNSLEGSPTWTIINGTDVEVQYQGDSHTYVVLNFRDSGAVGQGYIPNECLPGYEEPEVCVLVTHTVGAPYWLNQEEAEVLHTDANSGTIPYGARGTLIRPGPTVSFVYFPGEMKNVYVRNSNIRIISTKVQTFARIQSDIAIFHREHRYSSTVPQGTIVEILNIAGSTAYIKTSEGMTGTTRASNLGPAWNNPPAQKTLSRYERIAED